MILPDPKDTEEVRVHDVAQWISMPADQRPRLIDCREAEELQICQIAGNEWLPLGAIPSSVSALKQGEERGIVVYCHHGMRSLRAARFLRQQGLEHAFSMAGGIDAWGRIIDPSLPRY
jgi:rhodanese-related sulfurtransferase